MAKRIFVEQTKGAGLFLDPGLGKTRTTLAFLNLLYEYGEIKRALIVAPLRPIYTVWPNEVKRWGFPQSIVNLHGQHARGMAENAPFELVNYEGLEKLCNITKRWDCIVFDESTFVKSWKAKRSKFARMLCQSIPRRVILTGTPAANSLADVYGQVYLLDDGQALGKNVTAFRSRFCHQGGFRGREWSVRDGAMDSIRKAIEPLVLRMQAEDFLDMPQLVQNEIWVKMPSKAVLEYKRLKRELFAQLETGDVFAATASAAYAKCRQFANGQVYTPDEENGKKSHVSHEEKKTALFELFEELGGKPLLVFYQYKHDLEMIRGGRNSPFKGCPVISGGMKPAELDAILKGWNAGEYKGLCAQWQAASHGLNMQGACNDVACFGVVDSLEVYDQAIRRVYRQGVKGAQVRIHRILTQGTVDEIMLERLNGKHACQSEFLNALKKHAKG
jgi:SNF2 family DNA or RNA helicase